MTLSSTTVKDLHAGDGSTKTFATSWVFYNSSELKVVHISSGGTRTTWSEGTEYEVTGGLGNTGSITVSSSNVSIPATNEKVLLQSNIANVQGTSLPSGGIFPSTNVEQELDRMVRKVQQLSEKLDRALLLQEGSTYSGIIVPDPTADNVIRWGSSGGVTMVNSST